MKFSFTQKGKRIEMDVSSGVYYPREDSVLLARAVSKEPVSGKILDMGCGCGFLTVLMSGRGEVTAADIDSAAVKNTEHNLKKLGLEAETVQSNLFSNVSGSFDYIIFNPPYLPVKGEDKIWSGGTTGRKVISQFAYKCQEHLNDLGKVFVVFSSLTGEGEVKELFGDMMVEVVSRKKMPWEELIVLKAQKRPKMLYKRESKA